MDRSFDQVRGPVGLGAEIRRNNEKAAKPRAFPKAETIPQVTEVQDVKKQELRSHERLRVGKGKRKTAAEKLQKPKGPEVRKKRKWQ